MKIYLPFIFETLQKPWFSDETRYLGHLETIEWGCFLYESGDGIIKKGSAIFVGAELAEWVNVMNQWWMYFLAQFLGILGSKGIATQISGGFTHLHTVFPGWFQDDASGFPTFLPFFGAAFKENLWNTWLKAMELKESGCRNVLFFYCQMFGMLGYHRDLPIRNCDSVIKQMVTGDIWGYNGI